MAAERLSLRKIREVLRLHGLGLSRRDIGRSAGISHNTAGLYISRAEAAGLSPDAAAPLDDAELEARLLTASLERYATTGAGLVGRAPGDVAQRRHAPAGSVRIFSVELPARLC